MDRARQKHGKVPWCSCPCSLLCAATSQARADGVHVYSIANAKGCGGNGDHTGRDARLLSRSLSVRAAGRAQRGTAYGQASPPLNRDMVKGRLAVDHVS